MILSLCSYLFKINLLDAKKLNYKTQDNNQINYKSKSCRAAEFSKFYKFSMERKAGLASDAGGSLTGVLGSEIPSSSLIVIGFCTDPSSKERGSRRLVEPQTLSQESRGSSFPHAESLPPSFALFQVGSM